MRKLVLHTALSADGFIAGPNGETDWLHAPEYEIEGEDYGLGAFWETLDTTLMGHKTYQAVMGFDVPFPYVGTTNYVFSRNPKLEDNEHVEFVSGDIASFVAGLKEKKGRDIWLIGGGQINAILLEAGLIDEIVLTYIPVAIGMGIPLFDGLKQHAQFSLTATKSWDSGLTQLTYVTAG